MCSSECWCGGAKIKVEDRVDLSLIAWFLLSRKLIERQLPRVSRALKRHNFSLPFVTLNW